MRAIAISDVHFHSWPAFATVSKDGVNSRLAHTRDRMLDVERLAERHGAEFILFGGDAFHTKKIEPEVIDTAVRSFSGKVPIIGTPGNHDLGSDVLEIHSARALSSKIRWLDQYNGRSVSMYGCTIVGIPYQRKPDILRLCIEEARDHKPTILLMHAGFAGAQMGSDYIADLGDCIDPRPLIGVATELVVSGHFHRPQVIDLELNKVVEPKGNVRIRYTPGKTILIPGAPEEHNFGDEGSQRGCWLIDTEQKTLEFFPLQSPKFVTVDAMAKYDPAALIGCYVRVVNAKPGSKPEAQLLEAGAFGAVVEERQELTKVQRQYEISHATAPQEVLRQYVAHSQTPLDRERLIKEGLRLIGCA